MANTIEYASVFQQELDKAFVHEACTSWMDDNAGLVKYEGGREIKIPTMVLSGLADYDRSNGFVEGEASLTYETKTMSQDRGRGFTLDSMDVDETNFAASAGALLGEFQREHVVPEVDAYRLAKLYAATQESMRETGYALAASSAYGKLVDHIAKVRDVVGANVQLMIHMSYAAKAALSKSTEFQRRLDMADFKRGELTTKVKSLDGDLLLDTPSACLKTAYIFYKGAADSDTDKVAGGFAPASDAKDIHWLIIPRKAPIAVCKQDKARTFDPSTYQKANAWHVDYRKYHDLWVTEKKAKALFACTA